MSSTLGNITPAITGTVVNPVQGILAATLGNVGASIQGNLPVIGSVSANLGNMASAIHAELLVKIVIDGNFIRFGGGLTAADALQNVIDGNFIKFDGSLGSGLEIDGNFIAFSGSLTAEDINTVQIDGNFIAFSGSLTAEPVITAQIDGNFIKFGGSLGSGLKIDGNFIRFSGALAGEDVDSIRIDGNFIRFSGKLAGEDVNSIRIDGNFIKFGSDAPFIIDSNFIRFGGQLAGAEIGADGLPIEMKFAVVMNTKTAQVTRYGNFGGFIRIIVVQGKHFAVAHDGVYEITGPTDHNFTDPTKPIPVNGQWSSGETDFGDSFNSKWCHYAYLNSDTETQVTPYVDNVRKLPHLSAFKGRKTKLSKQPSGRFWRFKIGKIAKLDGAEFIGYARQRRIK